MKKLIAFTLLLSLVINSFAQDISGKWEGILDVQSSQLKLVFNIEQSDEGYSATMDSPNQNAFGIPVSSVLYQDKKLNISVQNGAIIYEATLDENEEFKGTFKQSGFSFPLNLKKSNLETKGPNRPQEPKKPYPYYTEDVIFLNKTADIELSGTLTLPSKEGKYPVAILISGSGPQDRDESIMGHKPFLVIADYLTKQGYGVLRFDDRGTGKSKGNFQTATSYDFSTDVEAAVEYLYDRNEIDNSKISLIGHSEGGIIAPMLAARNKKVSSIVLLAGVGVAGDELLISQQKLMARQAGMDEKNIEDGISINIALYKIIKEEEDIDSLRFQLDNYLKQEMDEHPEVFTLNGMSEEAFLSTTIATLSSPWMRYFINFTPNIYLEKVDCPVLAINGSKDLQVPADENLKAIKESIVKGGNKKVTIKKLENLNHLFQECETGAISEYAEIEQTFSPIALETISSWLKSQK